MSSMKSRSFCSGLDIFRKRCLAGIVSRAFVTKEIIYTNIKITAWISNHIQIKNGVGLFIHALI